MTREQKIPAAPMDDPLPWHRPALCPSRMFDEVIARFRRTAALRTLRELREAGLRVSLAPDGERLLVGPPQLVINGTAQKLNEWRGRLIQVLRETVAPTTAKTTTT